MRYILLVFLFVLAGCGEREPEKTYKYTVWVGSAAFASGYDTDHYLIKDDMYIFVNKSGKTKMVPREQILSIDVN